MEHDDSLGVERKLLPDMPEGRIRAFDRDARTRVCAPSVGRRLQVLSRLRRTLSDKFFAMRRGALREHDQNQRMRHRAARDRPATLEAWCHPFNFGVLQSYLASVAFHRIS